VRARRCSIGLLALASLATGVWAHVRLSVGGTVLFWQTPSNIQLVISSAGSDDLPDGSHFTALRNAYEAWNQDAGTAAQLIEDASPSQQVRTDWQADDLHLVFFDEDDSTGYFPVGSATVALTPISFAAGGRILDADVVFNGAGFSFTTSNQTNAFDVQDVATHELGHFLGLDHSGWAGASLYPYVSPGVLQQRSPSLDDQHGLREAYPAIAHGRITGTVRRASDNSLVAGAHVVAVDVNGRTAGGALANNSGAFQLQGLDAGTFALYATPLDFPVSSANLASGHTVQTDFRTTSAGSIAVAWGQTVAFGDVLVDADVALSLGRNYDELPLRGYAGAGNLGVLHGAGLVPGCALTCSDPTIAIAPLSWMTTQVVFTITPLAGAPDGHADLTVTNAAGESSTLPAAIEVTPLDPAVSTVAPAAGSVGGGTALTISGSGFRAGARVVVGPEIYPDGVPGGCVVVDASTITLDTQASAPGTYDVVVIDPTGVEGRKSAAYTFTNAPVIASVFPSTGTAAGGTQVVLRGQDFLPGMLARIDGVDQPQLTVHSPTRAVVITEPGVVGGPYALELENPGAAIATSAFTYAATPDPSLAAVSPPAGPPAGGSVVTLSGADFTPDSEVFFGVDPDTGAGGVAALGVTFIDSQRIDVTTPGHAAGAVAVLVQSPSTGQSDVLGAAYTYQTAGGGGGGGGGCSTRRVGEPWSWRDALGALATTLLLWTASSLQRRALRPARKTCAA
jgi:matrixin/IPT/TIG domain-containing protein